VTVDGGQRAQGASHRTEQAHQIFFSKPALSGDPHALEATSERYLKG